MTPGFNGVPTVIDIPAAGTLQAVLALGPCRYFEIEESNLTAAGTANTKVGFDYKLPNDGFTQLLSTPNIGDVVKVGDRQSQYGSMGIIQGQVAQPIVGDNTIVTSVNFAGVIQSTTGRAATTLFTAQSATAAGTSIKVTQWF